MAERRMFAKTIVLSDAFLDMGLGARCLYMTLGMVADDDGFVNSPKSIMRQTGATEDDMKVLIAKKFIIPFESGVIVIKHWRINNYLRNDRYHETTYLDEKAELDIDQNGAYTMKDVDGIPGIPTMVYQGIPNNGIPSIVQDSIDKSSKDKSSKGESEGETRPVDATPQKRFVKPSFDDVQEYCRLRGDKVDAKRFYAYYESNGWSVGRGKMKDWKAAVRYWETDEKKAKSYSRPGSYFTATGNEESYAMWNSAMNTSNIDEDTSEEDLAILGIGSALRGE